MSTRVRAAIAGIVGAVLAFGIAELVHGLYAGVPSVFVSLAQQMIQLTPGGFATRAIEILGQADIPTLVTSMVIGALVVAALLGNLALRSPTLVLLCVAVLSALAIIAALAAPSVVAVATIVTILAALAIGVTVSAFLIRTAVEPSPRSAAAPSASADSQNSQMAGVRSRDAGPDQETSIGRKGFLTLSGTAAVVGLVAVGAGRMLAGRSEGASAPKKLNLGGSSQSTTGSMESTSPDGTEGTTGGEATTEEVTHETLPPPPKAASLDVEGISPLVTSASDFYLIDTALTSPSVNANDWSLSVKGEVDNPVEFSYNDLLGMNTREVDITLSCVSNKVGGQLISNGRWTGVLLSDILNEAGVSKDKLGRANEQLVGRSVDGFTAGFKTKIALDGREALVAFGLNGDELPVKHGYPVRLVVPGLYGYVSATKWLQEIELTNWDYETYWITRTWTKEGPIKTQSRIDTPSGDVSSGNVQIAGVAWAPHRGISKVEVSTDGGDSWNEARLAKQLTPDTWRQYVYDWDAPSGDHTLQVRATDGEGETQTSRERDPHGGGGNDGATGYDTVQVSVA